MLPVFRAAQEKFNRFRSILIDRLTDANRIAFVYHFLFSVFFFHQFHPK